MTSEEVARYLKDHPEFFEEYADLLAIKPARYVVSDLLDHWLADTNPRRFDMIIANLKRTTDFKDIADGDRMPMATKDLGACDIYPQSLQHSPNARLVAACGVQSSIAISA